MTSKNLNPGRPDSSDKARAGQVVLVGEEWDDIQIVAISEIEEPRGREPVGPETRQLGPMLIVLLAVLAGYGMGVDDIDSIRDVASKVSDAVLVVAVALTGSKLLTIIRK